MAREILFKAKRIDNGEWVIGYYQKRYDETGNILHYIFKCENHIVWEYAEVDESTLSQYTGLTDKNGNKIWENDIAKDKKGCLYKAIWNKKYLHTSWECVKATFDVFLGKKWDFTLLAENEELEVIGNMFDNPELLESEE